jgi:hypothetical protein
MKGLVMNLADVHTVKRAARQLVKSPRLRLCVYRQLEARVPPVVVAGCLVMLRFQDQQPDDPESYFIAMCRNQMERLERPRIIPANDLWENW